MKWFKKISMIIWAFWAAIASFLTPHIVFISILGITGQIRRYDWSIHEGDADLWVLFGIFYLALWGVLFAFPGILFLHKIKQHFPNRFIGVLCFMMIVMLIGAAFVFGDYIFPI